MKGFEKAKPPLVDGLIYYVITEQFPEHSDKVRWAKKTYRNKQIVNDFIRWMKKNYLYYKVQLCLKCQGTMEQVTEGSNGILKCARCGDTLKEVL